MKSKKLLWVTLTVLLTLVMLAGVAGAGFRMGVMQSSAFMGNAAGGDVQPFERMRGFDGGFDRQFTGDLRMMQDFGHGGFDRSRFDSGRMGFFSLIFELITSIMDKEFSPQSRGVHGVFNWFSRRSLRLCG